MKTVSGKIVSTKPVNLSKAANILSNFITIENGASQSVSTYLRRASVAFNELVYFKKHHKLQKNRTKEEGLTKSDMSERNLEDEEVRVMENGAGNMKFDHGSVEIEENGMGKVEGESRKKEKKKKKRDGSLGSGKNDNVEVVFEEGNENVKEKSDEKKKKKKRKNAEVDGGEVGNSVAPERKKKRRKTEGHN